MPSGKLEQALEGFLVVAEKSELGQTEHQTRFVEHTHDDAFAMIGRNSGNAQIDRLAADLHLDAPVLRQPFFRDAHRAGHDFEPADDGGLKALRRRLHFLRARRRCESGRGIFCRAARGEYRSRRRDAPRSEAWKPCRMIGASVSFRRRRLSAFADLAGRDRHLRRFFPRECRRLHRRCRNI